jgi:ABC-2 type transport system permease protein
MGIGQILTMPLFFASNAIYPLSMMPSWLQIVARVNPLTYAVDAMRGLMIKGGVSTYGVGFDLLVLFVVTIALVLIGAKLYPKVVI